MILKIKRITMCDIIQLNRRDFPKLLMNIKQKFFKDILYEIFVVMIQNDVLLII